MPELKESGAMAEHVIVAGYRGSSAELSPTEGRDGRGYCEKCSTQISCYGYGADEDCPLRKNWRFRYRQSW